MSMLNSSGKYKKLKMPRNYFNENMNSQGAKHYKTIIYKVKTFRNVTNMRTKQPNYPCAIKQINLRRLKLTKHCLISVYLRIAHVPV